jgi:type III secretion system chaperone SycN
VSAQHALEQFGQTLGIQGLQFGDEGACRLQWEDGTALSIEECRAGILVSLEVPAPHVGVDALLKALQQCDQMAPAPGHGGQADVGPVQIGLAGRGEEARLVASSRVVGSWPSGADLDHAVQLLVHWRRRWSEACGQRGG